MKIVDFNNTNHTIRLVPRFYPSTTISVQLNNEVNGQSYATACTYVYENGFLDINFDFVFTSKDKFSFKLIENNNVVYRGKIFSTIEETQNYKQSTNLYEY